VEGRTLNERIGGVDEVPVYRVTFVSRHIEGFEVEAANEHEARELVYAGEVDPIEVVEIADGVTEIRELEGC